MLRNLSFRSNIFNILVICLLIGIWQYLSVIISYDQIPSPYIVIYSTVKLLFSAEFYRHLSVTTSAVISAFLISFCLCSFLCLFYIKIKSAQSLIQGATSFSLLLPSIVISYLAIIFLRNNMFTKLIIIICSIAPHIFSILIAGVINLNKKYNDMGNVYGIGAFKIFRHITIPQLLPTLIASFDNGIAMAWKIAVLAEAFVSNQGVGYMISYQFHLYSLDGVLSWLLAYMLVMIIFQRMLRTIFKSLHPYWIGRFTYE